MNKRKRYDLSKYPLSRIRHTIDEWIPNKLYREILKLAYIDGESNEEISSKCGCSVGTIKNVIKLAYPRLIDCLEHEDKQLNIVKEP